MAYAMMIHIAGPVEFMTNLFGVTPAVCREKEGCRAVHCWSTKMLRLPPGFTPLFKVPLKNLKKKYKKNKST
jgi:hypothetical protein